MPIRRRCYSSTETSETWSGRSIRHRREPSRTRSSSIDPGGTQTVTKNLTNGTATGALECDTNVASSGEADADVTGGTHPVIARFLGAEGFEPSVSDTVYVSCSSIG